jgi:hypothetical protein
MTVEPSAEDVYALFVKLSKENPPRVYTRAEKNDFGNAFDTVDLWLKRTDCQLALDSPTMAEPPGILITVPNKKVLKIVQERMKKDHPLRGPLKDKVTVYVQIQGRGPPLDNQVEPITDLRLTPQGHSWCSCFHWLY